MLSRERSFKKFYERELNKTRVACSKTRKQILHSGVIDPYVFADLEVFIYFFNILFH